MVSSDKASAVSGKGFCSITRAVPSGIVIFGASGDLAHRKLIPSLSMLFKNKLLPENSYIIGCARTKMKDDEFRKKAEETLKNKFPQLEKEKLNNFLEKCFYISGNYDDDALYLVLEKRLKKLNKIYKTNNNTLFYLSTPPALYTIIINRLGINNLVKEEGDNFKRVIFEKPFGRDLASAIKLDEEIHLHLKEKQIYRIDHYMGKETVQNILMFRFANAIFEPIWNRNYIDHVQISVTESLGVEHRAGYYDESGQLRDMFQNHMMQMLAMVAIEPPASFDADRVRDEKVKLFRSIKPFQIDDPKKPCMIRSQYLKGNIDNKEVRGYLDEEGVSKNSTTETFVAAKLMIENWRWRGVPFYLRSGKHLKKKISEIAIFFKKVPHSMFYPLTPEDLEQNTLILNVYPDEGISLTIEAKVPGGKVCLTPLSMNFTYKDIFGVESPESYERLLLDCMMGDQTLFWRNDAVELSWSIFTPVLKRWEEKQELCPLTYYPSGSWGPDEANWLLMQDGRYWRNL